MGSHKDILIKDDIISSYTNNLNFLFKNYHIVFAPAKTRSFLLKDWNKLEKKLAELDDKTKENLKPMLVALGFIGAGTFAISGSTSTSVSTSITAVIPSFTTLVNTFFSTSATALTIEEILQG